jgi:hypothetical protein
VTNSDLPESIRTLLTIDEARIANDESYTLFLIACFHLLQTRDIDLVSYYLDIDIVSMNSLLQQ